MVSYVLVTHRSPLQTCELFCLRGINVLPESRDFCRTALVANLWSWLVTALRRFLAGTHLYQGEGSHKDTKARRGRKGSLFFRSCLISTNCGGVCDRKVILWGRSLTCQLTESLTPGIGSGEMRIRWVRAPFNRQIRGLPHKVTFRSHPRFLAAPQFVFIKQGRKKRVPSLPLRAFVSLCLCVSLFLVACSTFAALTAKKYAFTALLVFLTQTWANCFQCSRKQNAYFRKFSTRV